MLIPVSGEVPSHLYTWPLFLWIQAEMSVISHYAFGFHWGNKVSTSQKENIAVLFLV
jgi:hypothetical protein